MSGYKSDYRLATIYLKMVSDMNIFEIYIMIQYTSVATSFDGIVVPFISP